MLRERLFGQGFDEPSVPCNNYYIDVSHIEYDPETRILFTDHGWHFPHDKGRLEDVVELHLHNVEVHRGIVRSEASLSTLPEYPVDYTFLQGKAKRKQNGPICADLGTDGQGIIVYIRYDKSLKDSPTRR